MRFDESPWRNRSHLHVTRPDGRKVEYILREGKGHTLTLEEVVVKDGDRETRYSGMSKNADIAAVVEKAEPDVAKYLSDIVEEKVQQYK